MVVSKHKKHGLMKKKKGDVFKRLQILASTSAFSMSSACVSYQTALKVGKEALFYSLQFCSSELSPQSFWLSHLQWSGIQLLFSQRNSWGPQVFSSFFIRNKQTHRWKWLQRAWILMTNYHMSTCNQHFLRVSQSKLGTKFKTRSSSRG